MSRSARPARTEVGYLVHRLARPFADELQRRLHAAGVTTVRPAFSLVLALAREGGVSVSEVAEAWGVTTQAVTRTAKEMEEAGLVRRVKDAADRRVTLLHLTPAGEEALAAVRAAHRAIEADWARDLGRERLEDAREVLVRLLALLEAA